MVGTYTVKRVVRVVVTKSGREWVKMKMKKNKKFHNIIISLDTGWMGGESGKWAGEKCKFEK